MPEGVLRAVLDSNVFVSAVIRPQGPPGRILAAFLRERSFELVISGAILEEVRRSCEYPRVRKHIRGTSQELDQWVRALAVLGDVVHPDDVDVSLPDDPDDEKYLAAALEGRADFLVSGDSHLLELGRVQDVQIVKPRKFLEQLPSRA